MPLGKSQLRHCSNRLQWLPIGFVALVSYNVNSAMSEELKEILEAKSQWESYYRRCPFKELPWGEGRPSPQMVELIRSGLIEKGTALDMGTGSGDNAIYLAQQGFACYGIDISETAIRRAAEKTGQAGVTCEFTAGNATELPYADNTFNLVFDRGCFHSIPLQKRKAFIEGVHRVLKPGGKYLLICFGKISNRRFESPFLLSSEDIQSLFVPLFEIDYIKEIPDGRHGFGGLFLSVLMEKRP